MAGAPGGGAFHGLAGEVVRAVEPTSEADPAAILFQTLVGVGSQIGRTASFEAEADRHHLNEFLVLVGRTAKGRKGSSWGRVVHLLRQVEEGWVDQRVQTGLSSGEGLIWGVRDAITKRERTKERGGPARFEEVEADPGVEDKRLLVFEPEFANVLKQVERQGNTLSAVLRQAWDAGRLGSLTKNSPAKATDAHISLVGHCTADELRRYLSTTEAANGFGNRHLWVCVQRSKLLPEGGSPDPRLMADLGARLRDAVAFARTVRAMRRDDEARAAWHEVYGDLSAARPGMAGALLARAEAHVMRLACLYALLDGAAVVRAGHLLAALALWGYVEQSVFHVFGDSTGDPTADEVLRLLQASPGGMTRTELFNHFGRNLPSDRIGRALTAEQIEYAAADVAHLRDLYAKLHAGLGAAGLARVAQIEHQALPAFVWLASQGVLVDRGRWLALAEEAEQEASRVRRRLDAEAPARPGTFAGFDPWNWDSPQQVKEALALLGCAVEGTDDDTLAGLDLPFAALLREYRSLGKRTGTYGRAWLDAVAGDGRVYAGWRQLGSVAGRTSCQDPNLQQVPRDPRYRACFTAPPGRVLVKADHSQIQLRIAAKIANEKAMLDAYARGDDLHTLTAQRVLGKQDVTKADRQLAKAVNFGLLFGLGARGFRLYARSNYGLTLTEQEAARYRQAFFDAYPGLAAWHRRAGQKSVKETRTLAGCRRLLDEKTPYTHRLNTPVQGTEADGLKAALALLWERRQECPGAVPVLAVHDEVVVECDQGQAEAAAAWLRRAMLDGMRPLADPVPVEVEVKVGKTWGGDA